MKISLNHYTSNLLVETKASSDELTFNQLLIEAMEYLHNKYVIKEQYAQNKVKPKSSWLFLREVI